VTETTEEDNVVAGLSIELALNSMYNMSRKKQRKWSR